MDTTTLLTILLLTNTEKTRGRELFDDNLILLLSLFGGLGQANPNQAIPPISPIAPQPSPSLCFQPPAPSCTMPTSNILLLLLLVKIMGRKSCDEDAEFFRVPPEKRSSYEKKDID